MRGSGRGECGPIIPFLNEPEIERIIEAAACGALNIHYTLVRLPWEVRPLFQEWLQHHVPDQAERIWSRIRELRGGQVYDADFRLRMRGQVYGLTWWRSACANRSAPWGAGVAHGTEHRRV